MVKDIVIAGLILMGIFFVLYFIADCIRVWAISDIKKRNEEAARREREYERQEEEERWNKAFEDENDDSDDEDETPEGRASHPVTAAALPRYETDFSPPVRPVDP